MRVPERNIALGVGVGVGAVLGGIWAWRHLTAEALPHTWEEVGEVSDLIIYPLKSARGISKKDAFATTYGFRSGFLEDRSLMVISDNGSFITGRQVGTLTSILTQMEGQILTLKAKGHDDLQVDLKRDHHKQPVVTVRFFDIELPGVDCGDKAADWLSEVLYNGKSHVRLIYKGDVLNHRQAKPPKTPKAFNFPQFRKKDRLYYADEASFMLSSQSSLDDLNSRLSEPVVMGNFRPNIVVSGTKPYDEDDWTFVRIGQVVLRRLKPCDRCIMVTIDPLSGTRHPKMEPLTTLKKYRVLEGPDPLTKPWTISPIFGASLAIDVTGPVRVGDKVFVARA